MTILPPILHANYINVPIEKVFETLTTAKGWDAWFTKGMELDSDTGKMLFVWKNWGPDKVNTTASATIQSYEPTKEFSFIWQEGKHNTLVKFTLSPLGKGTKVEVSESGYKNNDVAATDMNECATGWGEALTLLKFYLEHGVVYEEVP
ncbi:MAG: SRPBCC family protein [bacterium]